MATCTHPDFCKPIGSAVIGISFKIGCTPCPPDPLDYSGATMSSAPGTYKVYKKKFQKAGIRI